LLELPQGLAGADRRLFFERDPLPKPLTWTFVWDQSCTPHIVICTHHGIFAT